MRIPVARIRRASSLNSAQLMLIAAMIVVAMMPTFIDLGTQLIVALKACASTLHVREGLTGPLI
jgi:hypothetical protein